MPVSFVKLTETAWLVLENSALVSTDKASAMAFFEIMEVLLKSNGLTVQATPTVKLDKRETHLLYWLSASQATV